MAIVSKQLSALRLSANDDEQEMSILMLEHSHQDTDYTMHNAVSCIILQADYNKYFPEQKISLSGHVHEHGSCKIQYHA